jgi:ParB family chromosome partitioning protein
MSGSRVVHLSSISAPEAPLRRAIEAGGIEELTVSIRQVGLLNPLTVKACPNGFEVVAGHRRLLACRMAPLEMVPINVVEGDAVALAAVKLAENTLREDLSPVEEAHALREWRDVLGLSVAEIAGKLGKSEAWVRGRLDLLLWPDHALTAIASGRAAVSALRPLMELEDVGERDRLIECAVESGATASVTRAWVAGVLGMASSLPVELSSRVAAALPLAEYVVHMPCFACRQSQPAIDLRVVRICDGCLQEIYAASDRASVGVAEGGGVNGPAS